MPIRMSGMVSGMDTESIVAELMKAQRMKLTKIENKKTVMEWKQEKWKALNTKLYSFYTGSLSKLKAEGSYQTKKASSNDESKATITTSNIAAIGSHSLSIEKLASSQFVTGNKLDASVTGSTLLKDLSIGVAEGNKIVINAGTAKEKSIEIKDTTTVSDLVKTMRDAGLNANFDTTHKRFFISSKESGYDNAFTLSTEGTVDLSRLGLGEITTTTDAEGVVTVSSTSDIKIVQPSDAKILYNGVSLTSSSNNISVNGLNITLKEMTEQPISITVANDTQAVYDMVKGFIKTYNELLTEMNTYYQAESTRGFDPLTSEQKEAMTDDEIEKWETKIKDSLLRRDSNLSSLIDTLRTTMSGAVSYNGKNYALSSFGIGSLNYTEKGVLHIKGDIEDSAVAAEENKLMNALTEDPDKVMTVLTGLANQLYASFSKSMTSNSMRSALTLYNDKEMANQIKSYKKDMATLEAKLNDMESRYFKQFTAMETAMSKLNSQSASLASMMGFGNQK